MRWLNSNIWKAGIVLASLLLLLVLMVWVPVSAAGASERTPELAGPGTVTLQTPSTADLTVTAVVQDQLMQQDERSRRDNSFPWTILNAIGGPILAALAAIAVAFFGLYQWRGNQNAERRKEVATQEKESNDRKEAQDKELRERAEERFQAAVAALGDKNEGTQIGGAILLRSFLHEDDEKIYGRYYTQIFDLAVAYLHLPSTSQPSEDKDGTPPSPRGPDTSLPLTPLRQALIVVFKEVFPLARDKLLKEQGDRFHHQFLDATGVLLDGAYLWGADLELVWMPHAFLRKANLGHANLRNATLKGDDLSGADFLGTDLSGANLWEANLSATDLSMTNLGGTELYGVDLSGANLSGADLRTATLENPRSLKDTYLGGVSGLPKELLEAFKAKMGAILDVDNTTDSSLQDVAPPQPSPSIDAQAPPAQAPTPPASTDGSNIASSQPSAEP